MPVLTNIIKMNREDYQTLVQNGSVTIDDVTYTHDANAMYMIPDYEIVLLTLTQYNDLVVKDSNTLYIITND